MSPSRPDSQTARAAAFGSRIRQLRRAQKLTQRQMAARIPMSAPNLSRIENGEQGPPDDETIERMSQALGADADELLRLAGRRISAEGFEARVLDELSALRAEVRQGFDRLERAIAGRR